MLQEQLENDRVMVPNDVPCFRSQCPVNCFLGNAEPKKMPQDWGLFLHIFKCNSVLECRSKQSGICSDETLNYVQILRASFDGNLEGLQSWAFLNSMSKKNLYHWKSRWPPRTIRVKSQRQGRRCHTD